MHISAWKRVALCVACVGMILPQGALVASDRAVQNTDIGLQAGGTLRGSVVDSQGKPVAGSPVVVLYKGMTIAQTKTNAQGAFAVQSLRGGVHEVRSATGRTVARLWAPNTAPQSAKTAALVVDGKDVVRGQCGEAGCGEAGCTSCGAGGGTFGNGGGMFGNGGGMFGGNAGSGAGLLGGGAGAGAGAGAGGLLLGGLLVGGVVWAVAEAADDDDDGPSSP